MFIAGLASVCSDSQVGKMHAIVYTNWSAPIVLMNFGVSFRINERFLLIAEAWKKFVLFVMLLECVFVLEECAKIAQ
jgi:hypothetical protein